MMTGVHGRLGARREANPPLMPYARRLYDPGMLSGSRLLTGVGLFPPAGVRAAGPSFEGRVERLETVLVPGAGSGAEAAVRVKLSNGASKAWAVEEATLVSSTGEALGRVRTLTPVAVPPMGLAEFFVVSGLTEGAVAGTYTLKLRGRGRELAMENISFK